MKRIELAQIKDLPGSYRKKDGTYYDISQIKRTCYCTPDMAVALEKAVQAVSELGGTLRITDLFRDWNTQYQAHLDYLRGKKKAFVAPPGSSFHNAGRAVDFDVFNIDFPNIPKEKHLSKLWDLILPMGFKPIIGNPDIHRREAWHFDFPGKEWEESYDQMLNKMVAKCCILDVGRWDDPKIPPEQLKIMFIQAQLARVLGFFGPIDGVMSPETKMRLLQLNLDLLNLDETAGVLAKMSFRKKK